MPDEQATPRELAQRLRSRLEEVSQIGTELIGLGYVTDIESTLLVENSMRQPPPVAAIVFNATITKTENL